MAICGKSSNQSEVVLALLIGVGKGELALLRLSLFLLTSLWRLEDKLHGNIGPTVRDIAQ